MSAHKILFAPAGAPVRHLAVTTKEVDDQVSKDGNDPLKTWIGPHERTEKVLTASLKAGYSPRLKGENLQHIRLLVEAESPPPPILVHKGTMRIIDGMHRLQAARLRQQDEIEVIFFEGTDEEAFIAAVKANNSHGLPLTLADREAAAARIIRSHPQRSDRWIGSIAGLAPGTVASIRSRTGSGGREITTRIGRDGRSRPLSAATGRRLASAAIAKRPDAPLREIARIAGISLGTARDVRERVRRGEDPAPIRRSKNNQIKPDSIPLTGRNNPQSIASNSAKSRVTILADLKKDPSLRYTDSGRMLLRLLQVISDGTVKCKDLIDKLPPHCAYSVAQFIRECASEWCELAVQIDEARAP